MQMSKSPSHEQREPMSSSTSRSRLAMLYLLGLYSLSGVQIGILSSENECFLNKCFIKFLH